MPPKCMLVGTRDHALCGSVSWVELDKRTCSHTCLQLMGVNLHAGLHS